MLTMPSVEKRTVAVRAAASVSAPTPVIVSSRARGTSVPAQAVAAIRCRTSCGWMKKAFDASAADGVTGPSQAADESGGQNYRDRLHSQGREN